MRIEPVKSEDKQAVLQITRNTWSWGDYIADVFDEWLTSGIFLKATWPSGELAGIVHGVVYRGFVWIEGLRVSEKFRRMGVGSSLVRAVIEASRRPTARALILDSNTPSLSLFKAMGFAEVAEVYYHEGDRPVSDLRGRPSGKKFTGGYLDDWMWYAPNERPIEIFSAEVEGEAVFYLPTKPTFLVEGRLPAEYSFACSEKGQLTRAEAERYVVMERSS